jgi:hypothetical protein
MLSRLTVSALFVAGLLAVATGGQPPAGDSPGQPPKGADKEQPLGDKVKPADPADAAVAAALANDPDVKVARAKVQLAEAELAKARQAVVLKVMTLNATIREHRAAAAAAKDRLAWATQLVQKGVMDQRTLLEERAKLEAAEAALARAETELKLLTGGTGDGFKVKVEELPGREAAVIRAAEFLTADLLTAQNHSDEAVMRYLAAAREGWAAKQAVKGPIPDRIRAALDKPVRLVDALRPTAKGDAVPFDKALEVFKKDAGLDVAVSFQHPLNFTPIQTTGEELPVGAWLQLFADANPDYTIVVREYGLLVTVRKEAPPDAPTITEFWKQKPAKKEPGPEPKGIGR